MIWQRCILFALEQSSIEGTIAWSVLLDRALRHYDHEIAPLLANWDGLHPPEIVWSFNERIGCLRIALIDLANHGHVDIVGRISAPPHNGQPRPIVHPEF